MWCSFDPYTWCHTLEQIAQLACESFFVIRCWVIPEPYGDQKSINLEWKICFCWWSRLWETVETMLLCKYRKPRGILVSAFQHKMKTTPMLIAPILFKMLLCFTTMPSVHACALCCINEHWYSKIFQFMSFASLSSSVTASQKLPDTLCFATQVSQFILLLVDRRDLWLRTLQPNPLHCQWCSRTTHTTWNECCRYY